MIFVLEVFLLKIKKVFKSIYGAIPFKKQIYTVIKKFWIPPQSICQHLHFKGIFKVKIDSTHSFLINHYGYEIENEIFWRGLSGGFENISMGFWVKLCEKANIIFDIGANTGVYSLLAKCLNSNAQVFAFEPVERVYEKLITNIKLNNYDVTCVNKAVSNNDGIATIYDTLTEHIYSVTVNKNLNSPDTLVKAIEIKTIKLKTFIEENKIHKIDLIKIDVETHEPEVLEGFDTYLDKFRPTLIIEILNDEVGQRVENSLKDKDYLYFNIHENAGSVRQVEHITKSDEYNYLICSKQIAEKLGLHYQLN